MRLILVDRGRDFTDVLKWQFRPHPEVEIVCGRFEDLPAFDCMVTAGNSFGLMDAGVDLAVVKFIGQSLMERIQKIILDDYLGEQPVGTSLIVPTGNPKHPFVAHTPTMRIPMNINGTDHVYQGMWAALTAVHRHNRDDSKPIRTLACPGLGTGTGGVEPLEAAHPDDAGLRALQEARGVDQSDLCPGTPRASPLRRTLGLRAPAAERLTTRDKGASIGSPRPTLTNLRNSPEP